MDSNLKNTLINPICADDELKLEVTLRPAKLNDYVGQEKIKSNLGIFIEAARNAVKPSITFFYTVRRVWEKQLWLISLPGRWVWI
jgi:hypothetical protein